jgi:hypothetical protein
VFWGKGLDTRVPPGVGGPGVGGPGIPPPKARRLAVTTAMTNLCAP